jgi:hypothetical protein
VDLKECRVRAWGLPKITAGSAIMIQFNIKLVANAKVL